MLENYSKTLKVLELDHFLKDISLLMEIKNSINLFSFYLVQHMLHQIKAQQFYANFLMLVSPLSQSDFVKMSFK